MKIVSIEHPFESLPRIKKKDGTLEHIYAPGSRHHVVHYDTNGPHCSEADCEINTLKKEKR